jgi:hypothetical protein
MKQTNQTELEKCQMRAASYLADIRNLAARLEVMVDHAKETYPHFESERGQRDIREAEIALRSVNGK